MRFLPHTSSDRQAMLKTIGVASIDALYAHVPLECHLKSPLDLPPHQGELEVERTLTAIANKNYAAHEGPFFLGAGSYYHHIPASVDHIIQRSEFLTSYTPYQPEVSQGTLTVIFEFQSMVAALTGMEVANASMYDGSTAMAEAALMARRITKRDSISIHGTLHPHYHETLTTYMKYTGGSVTHTAPTKHTACLIVQVPDFHGNVTDLTTLRAQCDEAGALLVVVVTEIISLGLLPAPKEADIVVGEGQSLGNPMQFGGPYVGFFACKETYLRHMPGRICGQTVDADGKRSFVLTLSTREQHIRREKATSNICTSQGLCATAFTIHLSLLGETGFKHLARLNHETACRLADQLIAIPGVQLENKTFFNEFVIHLPIPSISLVKTLAKQGIVAGLALDGHRLLVAATEMTSQDDIEALCAAIKNECRIT
jgi:glycine dehydrogenase subunit 1